jgi:hypothetical protein
MISSLFLSVPPPPCFQNTTDKYKSKQGDTLNQRIFNNNNNKLNLFFFSPFQNQFRKIFFCCYSAQLSSCRRISYVMIASLHSQIRKMQMFFSHPKVIVSRVVKKEDEDFFFF